MKIYQVGGAVRDKLLGKKPTDVDHVVIGASVDEMIALGFKSVGKRFPVFLHPETREEYALARKEVKTGPKHTDFHFIFEPTISLAEDVLRRDFTINALAQDETTGEIIDLVGGISDIKNRTIRHIDAEHFVEDPLRVLRMCRFSAQLDFKIHPETLALATKMVNDGMLTHLSSERIFQEIEKALATPLFDRFIEIMYEIGALNVILPEVAHLFNVPEKIAYHPEKNSGAHTILALKAAKNTSPEIKFAVLLHDVGKGITPKDILPSHYDHDKRGAPLVQEIIKRLKIPNRYKELAILGVKMHMKLRDVPEMRLAKLFDFVAQISNKFKNKEKIESLFLICQADINGRALPLEKKEFENFDRAKKRVMLLYDLMQGIKITDLPHFSDYIKNKTIETRFKSFALEKLKTKMD